MTRSYYNGADGSVVTVTSNHEKRALLDWTDLSPRHREDVAHYFNPALATPGDPTTAHQPTAYDPDPWEARWFLFRGEVYDLSEFEHADRPGWMRGEHGTPATRWAAWQTESAFSAVLVAFVDAQGERDDESVIVGYAHW